MPSVDIDTGILTEVLGSTVLSYLALMALWSSYAREAVEAGEADRSYDYARTAAGLARTAALCLHGRVAYARTGTDGW